MGTGIAQVAASAGHAVCLYDNNPDALKRSRRHLEKIFRRLEEKGKVTPEAAERTLSAISYVDSLYDCSGAELVIEAILEDLQAKKMIFERVEEIVSSDCILATNTSSLSIAAIASACRVPERVLGLHFFNPAPLMKLVEVVPAVQTASEVTHLAYGHMKEWGKSPVIARDTPGFIVNRVARPFYGEALRILEEGLAEVEDVDRSMRDLGGFRMGPFELMDYIGNDINFKVTETVFRAFYFEPRYRPSFIQQRMVEAGRLGRKTGIGFYTYDGSGKPNRSASQSKADERIFQRILFMLVNEAADALYLNIASREDLDRAMTEGVNYPKGLLAWADELGIARCVEFMDGLQDEYREDRYRCSPLLRRMARNGETFYP